MSRLYMPQLDLGIVPPCASPLLHEYLTVRYSSPSFGQPNNVLSLLEFKVRVVLTSTSTPV